MPSLTEALKPAMRGIVSLVGAGGKTSLMFRLARELSDAGKTVLTTTTTKIFIPTKAQSKHVVLSDSPRDIIQKAKRLLRDNRHVSAAKKTMETQGKLEGYPAKTITEFWRSKLFQWIIVEADGARQRPLKAPGRFEPVIPACSNIVIGVVGLKGLGKPLDEKYVFRPEVFAEITKLDPGKLIDGVSVTASILHQQGIMKGCPSGAMRIVFLNQADISNGLKTGRRIRDILIDQQSGQLNRIIIGNVRYDPPVLEYVDLI
jgi:probable selenium-dependent hydroxylase accessory protein YqeC